MNKVSPLAPARWPDMPQVPGVRLGAVETGERYSGRTDLMLALVDEATTVAGVFTRSACPSAPVEWCRANIGAGTARALIVNAGNANAFTGARGQRTVEAIAAATAGAANCQPAEILMASTGVIGEPMSDNAVTGALARLVGQAKPDGWVGAANAIRTTDTFAKYATASAEIDGVEVTLNGIAKGSGMIAPDMATMLGFIFTDANLPAPVLKVLLAQAVGASFNAITVDSDTSTSDTVLLFATAKAAHAPVARPSDPRLASFQAALNSLTLDLAQQIVRDGEGAAKFITVTVTGADTDASAKKIGFSIANSPLVKTAVAGEDPNWGRVVMAVGKAGAPADRDQLSIWFGPTRVALAGQIDPDYVEAQIIGYMKGQEIEIRVDLGLGQGQFTVWTCDLTHGYIAINADYRS
ncbi:MAG: bifunctional glutamate N-acetyltransferase/amino-acid acetyltransferase ArgJ [Alphaproteobacteria bacterium]